MSFNDVVREFQRRGIGDEDQITEYVAFLLLAYQYDPATWEQLSNTHPRELRPVLDRIRHEMNTNQKPVFPLPIPDDIWVDGLYRVLASLRALIEEYAAVGLGQFFQQQVRYHLLRSSRGERYPTPHHIATFMAQLILPQDHLHHFEDMSLFDPTCGTGGLLVAAHQLQPEIEFVGCDYNSRWARLGYANLRLNDVSNFTIQAQAAQQYQRFEPQMWRPRTERQFDYILMNPPFDSGVVFELIELAIHSLLEGGQAGLLTPAGVVQRSDDRIRLLENGLRAVITLPPDALRPYNGIQSHILLLDKASRDVPIWLCTLQADGYGTGMARPLDQPAYPEASELPRTQALFRQQKQPVWPYVFPLDNNTQLEVASLSSADNDNNHPGGVTLRVTGESAQPITWAACHLTSSALIWWGQSSLLLSDQFIYAGYEDGVAISLHRLNTEAVAWTNQLRAMTNAPLAAEWQVEEANISLTWVADNVILKQSGRNSFDDLIFAIDSQNGNGAILLDENDAPVSAWYWTEELPEKVEKAASNVGQALYDSTGVAVAWLLPFTADDNNLRLLLIKQVTISLFSPDNQDSYFGLLWQAGTEEAVESGGIWYLTDGQLITSFGPLINCNLRTPEGKALGIAFGPQPDNVSVASLFGACVARAALEGQSLEPERYLPEARPTVSRQRPAQVLAKIRQNQRAMDTHIDTLLSALGQGITQPYVNAMPLLPGLPLNEGQRTLWLRLSRQEETYLSLDQIEELGTENGLFAPVEVHQQIELLTSLGLLLPVTVEKQNLYRCVRQSDLVEVTPE